MDSKISKPNQCFLERSYVVLIELILDYNQVLVPFKQTPIFRRHLLDIKLTETKQLDFVLYRCLILAYISPTTNLIYPRI